MKKKFLVNHKHFPVNGLLIISMMFTLIANTFWLAIYGSYLIKLYGCIQVLSDIIS